MCPSLRLQFYASLTTTTLTCAATSRCSLIGTLDSPSCLIGSASWIFRRSISRPFDARPSAISADVTDPYSASVSPTRRAMTTSTCADARRQGFGRLALLGLARVGDLLLAFDLLAIALGDRQRELARQQVVPRVAVGNLDDVAAASRDSRHVPAG